MSEVQCLKIRLQPGKTEQAIEFLKYLKENRQNLTPILAAEGIILETLFLERGSEADYLIFYSRAKNLVEANRLFVESQHPLDLATKKFIGETWGEILPLTPLLDLETDNLNG